MGGTASSGRLNLRRELRRVSCQRVGLQNRLRGLVIGRQNRFQILRPHLSGQQAHQGLGMAVPGGQILGLPPGHPAANGIAQHAIDQCRRFGIGIFFPLLHRLIHCGGVRNLF